MTLLAMADPDDYNVQLVRINCDQCTSEAQATGETVDEAIEKLRGWGWTVDPGDHHCIMHEYKQSWSDNTENEFRGHVEGV